MLTRAHRENIFMILSSKLDKEGAIELEKDISVFIMELYNEKIKTDIEGWTLAIKNIKSQYNKRSSVGNVSLEGETIALSKVKDILKSRLNMNKDLIIEILK